MQGSSGGASSLLYSAAVTVRFFDAVALALFAPDLRGRRFRTAVCNSRRLGRPRSLTPGSARALACSLRRLAAMLLGKKSSRWRGAIASTRGACAPQTKTAIAKSPLLEKEHRSKDLCGAQAWKPVFPASPHRAAEGRASARPGHAEAGPSMAFSLTNCSQAAISVSRTRLRYSSS